jgi:acetyl-CoA synthetase
MTGSYPQGRDGAVPDDQLRLEVGGRGRTRPGAVTVPKEIVFERHLPRTNSGQIMRRLLRARHLRTPEGSPGNP